MGGEKASSVITLSAPQVISKNGRRRLTCEFHENGESKELWVEVDNEYAEYLLFERSDAFLIGMLPYAMHTGQDIKCTAPVTEELLYNIETTLIPTMVKNIPSGLYHTKIYCETSSEVMENSGSRGVGTGISSGVDSLHVIKNLLNPKYKSMKLSHLFIMIRSQFAGFDEAAEARSSAFERAKKIADELQLPLIRADSNYRNVIFLLSPLVIHFNMPFQVYALKKLWKTYFIASTYDYLEFSFTKEDSSYYETLLYDCFTIPGFRIYVEGAEKKRIEKMIDIADFDIARKNLHVCLKGIQNCGVCMKCRRTLVDLDMIGKLDNFRDVFDVDYYLEHRGEYFEWLRQTQKSGDTFSNDTCEYILDNLEKIGGRGKHIGKTDHIRKFQGSDRS